MFATQLGLPLDASHVRRTFKKICDDPDGLVPRELCHTFVSVMSEQGVAGRGDCSSSGHSTTSTTETVYRKELRPVISTGAEVMDSVFTVS